MMNTNKNIKSIDEYIGQYDIDIQEKLTKIRDFLRPLIPDVEEAMTYGIPTFKSKGKNIFHFANYESHIGLYPGSSAVEEFKDKLNDFKISKGTIQIKHDQDLPFELIKQMVKFNLENLE
ncbi:MAG TPA: DUF1801 domain-containing protein [Candidatus Dojkabacteria bacterium]|nr:DUF1801 domain-containing protein [Candidatus Dojkabacteria bacterium]HRP37466.1 DUF1801 domain-containing protein [Candidatus Dojkabacteria bacterium]HRP51273.1 DUF1801 domain-containing protein [Candidatus Dojkabacteria bacterium]